MSQKYFICAATEGIDLEQIEVLSAEALAERQERARTATDGTWWVVVLGEIEVSAKLPFGAVVTPEPRFSAKQLEVANGSQA
jgi:hypothetical protein